MNNPIVNLWRSQQFKLSLKRGDIRRAVQLLQEIQKSGARFSWLEKLFGLELVWYKYLTSTDSRIPLSGIEFGKFAPEKLPKKLYMSPILQQYFGQKHQLHYTLDDYGILAKKS